MDRSTVQRAIQRLVEKYQSTPEFFREDDAGLSLREIHFRESRFSKQIAKQLTRNQYRFSRCPAVVQKLSGKERTLFRLNWSDRIVHSALAMELATRLEPHLGSQLFSYRKGLGPERALKSLTRFLHSHRRKNPDPKTRGLFVFNADVSAYGESISVLPEARLWKVLNAELGSSNSELLLQTQAAVSPELRVFNTLPQDVRVKTGVPTGSALVPILNNVFLLELDRKFLTARRSGYLWYGRYGDDLLVASSNLIEFQDAVATLTSTVRELGLSLSEEKKTTVYWTGCGKKWVSSDQEISGTQWIEFLGERISFLGLRSPKTEKQKKLMRTLRTRLKVALNSARLQNWDSKRTLSWLNASARNLLDPEHPFSSPLAPLQLRVDVDPAWISGLYRWIRIRALSLALGRPFRPKILARWPKEIPHP